MIRCNKTSEKNEVVSELMKNFPVSQYPLFIKTLQLSFFWPLQKKSVQLIGRSFIILILLASSISSGIKLQMILKDNDLTNPIVFDIVYQHMVIVTNLGCYIFLTFNDDKIIKCMTLITKIFQGNDAVGQTIIIKTLKIAVAIHCIQIALLCPLYVNKSIVPAGTQLLKSWILPDDERSLMTLPFNMAYFFDEEEYFFYILAYQIFIAFICFVMLSLLSYLQSTVIGVIIGEIQCLQYYLKELDIENEYRKFVLKCTARNFFHRKFKEIIRQHQNCIELFETYAHVAKWLNFLVVICVSFMVVLNGTLFVVLWDEDQAEALKMVCLIIASLFVIIGICIPSQLLSNATNDLLVECYSIKWYKYPPKARLLLLLIMTRSMKDFAITFGPLTTPMNIETCTRIIKGSMSYIAACRSVYLSLK